MVTLENRFNKKKIMTAGDIMLLFMMLLASMNFMGRYYYCVFIGFIVVAYFKNKTARIPFSGAFFTLCILAICTIAFSASAWDKWTSVLKPFTYPMMFVLGYNFLIEKDEQADWEKKLNYLVAVIAIGGLIHILLNFITNYGSVERNTVDFWYNEVVSATLQAANGCVFIALAAAWLFSEAKLFKKMISVIGFAIIIGYDLILSGRTSIALAALVFIGAFLFFMILYKEKNGKSYKTKLLLGVGVLIILIILAYILNVGNLQTVIKQSNLYQRFFVDGSMGIMEDTRFENKLIYLQKVFSNLFGGGNIYAEIGKYAHDLYLDTWDDAGIIAFLAVAAYSILSIVNGIKFVANKNNKFEARQLVFCLYLVLHVQFMLEPILLGMPWLFASFCLLDGYIAHINMKNVGEKKNESR